MAKRTKPLVRTFDPIARLVEQVSLTDLRLVGSQTAMSMTGTSFPQAIEHLEHLQQQIDIESAVGQIDKVDHIRCVIRCTIGVKSREPPQEDAPHFHIEAAFELVYRVDSLEGISEELVTEFGQRNALYNAWPYWREFVQSMTTRMGLPALRIPLLRPPDLKFSPNAKARQRKKATTSRPKRSKTKR